MNDCPRNYECDGCVFKGTMDCALEDEEHSCCDCEHTYLDIDCEPDCSLKPAERKGVTK